MLPISIRKYLIAETETDNFQNQAPSKIKQCSKSIKFWFRIKSVVIVFLVFLSAPKIRYPCGKPSFETKKDILRNIIHLSIRLNRKCFHCFLKVLPIFKSKSLQAETETANFQNQAPSKIKQCSKSIKFRFRIKSVVIVFLVFYPLPKFDTLAENHPPKHKIRLP